MWSANAKADFFYPFQAILFLCARTTKSSRKICNVFGFRCFILYFVWVCSDKDKANTYQKGNDCKENLVWTFFFRKLFLFSNNGVILLREKTVLFLRFDGMGHDHAKLHALVVAKFLQIFCEKPRDLHIS